MIKVKSINVLPIKPDRVLVKWCFEPTFEDFNNFQFSLQKSASPESEYETIYTFTDNNQFVDIADYRRLWTSLNYRIVSKDKISGKEHISSPAQMGYAPNLEALEIIRRNDILLKNKRHGIGVPVAVFIRKHEGARCECWDIDKKRSRKSNCDDCFGTGFYNGVYPPIITWANLTPDNKTNPLPQWGETEPNDTRLFFSNYPEISPKDVIVEPTLMRVWIVESVETSARRGHMLHQLVTVSFLDRNNAFYKIVDKYKTLIDSIAKEKSKIDLS